jgi:hypothetical protein
VNSYKSTARIVGGLFITATVASIIGTFVFIEPIISTPDYLSNIYPNRSLLTIGVLIDAINSVAVVAIAVLLFPIFQKHNKSLAIGYVASRIIESVILIIGHISQLSLIPLSQEFIKAKIPDVSYFLSLGSLLISVYNWTWLLGPMILLGITALILNGTFYHSKMIPRFISIWGFIGGLLIIVAGLFGMFGLSIKSPISILLGLPIALNEMVLALWLIVKGFRLPDIYSKNG